MTAQAAPGTPARKWLMAEPRDVEGVIDLVVLEQFVARLPRRTAEWVQCHRPTSLAQAIQLAEDHLASGSASPGLISLSLALFPLPSHLPLSLALSPPPSRVPVAPQPHHGGNGQADRYPPWGGGDLGGRAPYLSTVLSPAIPCPFFCCWGGGKAWAGLLEMRGSRALSGPLSHDGGGIAGPGPRRPWGCPRSSPGSTRVPMSIKRGTYQALVDSGCNQTSIPQAWYSRGRWIRAARLR